MAVSLFLSYFGAAADGPALQSWFRSGPGESLRGADGINGLELYAPEASHDPFLDDAEGPLLIDEYDTTIVIPPDWSARMDGAGNIVLEHTHDEG